MNRSTEQAVFVVLMLALQEGQRPVTSTVLARGLGTSDSYLKKVLRTLTTSGLIAAAAGREGGFTLTRPIETITLGDVFDAMERVELPNTTRDLASRLFPPSRHLDEAIARVDDAFAQASTAFVAGLAALPLSELLEPDAAGVDWANRDVEASGRGDI